MAPSNVLAGWVNASLSQPSKSNPDIIAAVQRGNDSNTGRVRIPTNGTKKSNLLEGFDKASSLGQNGFEVLITGLYVSRSSVYTMPFYLCENCARDKVRLDLTYAGINQLWLRVSPSPEGFGPPCDFCNAPKTIYQVQIVGTKFDSENQHLEKMKMEIQQKT